MDSKKVSEVREWPRPIKVKQAQAFLGFANFYQRFIKDFAKHAKSLTILTKKDQPWTWGEEQEPAFASLKEGFTSAPILQISNDVNPFRLETDASNFATDAVLSQFDLTNKLWQLIAFYSKSLNVHERNYENELLLFWGKVYIPKGKNDHLQRHIVQMHHDLPSVGHPG